MGVPDSSPVCLSAHHHGKDTQFTMDIKEKDQRNNNVISFSRRRSRRLRRRRRPSLDACSHTAPAPPSSKEEEEEEEGISADSSTSPLKKVMKMSPPVDIVTREGEKVMDVVLDDKEAGSSSGGGGCKTPTSVEKKIPSGRQLCPPPTPRKPKTLPSSINKKGFPRSRRVLLDLSDEIESLFPPALLADFGNKIKKVRKETFII